MWLARDSELQREVAIKEIQPRFAELAEQRARFLLEAEVTGNLEHPGVVPVYSLGTNADGRPYYAMRFIRGESLAVAIKAISSRLSRERRNRRNPVRGGRRNGASSFASSSAGFSMFAMRSHTLIVAACSTAI